MANIEKARKEVTKAKKLLLGRFGGHAQVLGHLTRAVEHLIPDEPEAPPEPEERVSAETETTSTADATPEPESGTAGPHAAPEKPQTPKATRRRTRSK